MTELITSGVLTGGSVLLLAYWFRYMCLLILNARSTRDYAGEVAMANQLSFFQVQSQVGVSIELDRLQASLDRDYAVLTYLLKNAAHSGSEESSIEARMLRMNYRLVGAFARMSRPFSLAASRRAIAEMSLVLAHFADVMGERAASAA